MYCMRSTNKKLNVLDRFYNSLFIQLNIFDVDSPIAHKRVRPDMSHLTCHFLLLNGIGYDGILHTLPGLILNFPLILNLIYKKFLSSFVYYVHATKLNYSTKISVFIHLRLQASILYVWRQEEFH